MKKIHSILLLLAIAMLINISAYSQVNWTLHSPLNTGDNSLLINRGRDIKKVGDSLIFIGVGGVSILYNNIWTSLPYFNTQEARDILFASDGKIYVPLVWGGIIEIPSIADMSDISTWSGYSPSNTNIATNEFTAVFEAPDGKIWFGTQNGGIYVLNNGNWTNYSTQNSGLVNDTILDISYLNGEYLIGTENGFSVYDGNSWKTIMNATTTNDNGLYNQHILDLFIDNDDSLWLGTWYGASKWDGDTSFIFHQSSNPILNQAIKVTQDSDGDMWFVSQLGLVKFDGVNYSTVQAYGNFAPIPYDELRAIAFDNQDNMWLATDNDGFMKYDGQVWKVYNYYDGQPYLDVFSVGVDSQGSIWTASLQDDYNMNHEHAYGKYQNGNWAAITPETPSGEDIVSRAYSQLLDSQGKHWIATLDNGVAVETNGVWQVYNTSNSAITTNVTRNLANGLNGDVWLTTSNSLIKFDNQMNITTYTTSNSGLIDSLVYDVAIDSNGVVWAATRNGISRFDGTNWTDFDTLNYGGSNNSAYRIEVDNQQNVWVSVYGEGIVKYDGSTWQFYNDSNSALTSNYAYDLMIDSKGYLWMASSWGKGGVARFVDGKWYSYIDSTYSSGGNYFRSRALVEAPNGNVLIGTSISGLMELEICNNFSNSLLTVGDSSFCDGDSTILMANNSANITYKWFRNDTLLIGKNMSQINVTTPGIYHSIIVDTLIGCKAKSNYKNVQKHNNSFNIDFQANNTVITAPPFDVNFTNQTPQIVNYAFVWEFGDGNTSAYYHPYHQYQYDGIYDVKLTATNTLTGCVDEVLKTNYIETSGGTSCNINAQISPNSTATICSNDSIMLTANIGQSYTYQWVLDGVIIANADSSFLYAKDAGYYSVVINNGVCIDISDPFVLNQYPSTIPQILASGSLVPCTNDSIMLTLNSFYDSYIWSNGDTNAFTWVNNMGYYFVNVVDQFACNYTSSQMEISNSSLAPPTICIIGVDSLTGNNRVIWERDNSNLIDSIVVLRETSASNVYERVGAIDYSQTGIFIDPIADPAVRAWRYRLAAVDTCGALSLYSSFHKTIHLTINAGLNGSWNLIWDDYIGINVNSYYIYRGTTTNNMQLIAQMPGNLNSFTDLNPPTGTVFYQLSFIKINGCYPDSVFTKVNTNYNSSRSNTVNNSGIAPVFFAAEFNADVTSGNWPVNIDFTDASTGEPSNWLWNFGDGNSSNMQNPSHTYNNTGNYTVTLKIQNGLYNDSVQKISFINVLSTGEVVISSSTSMRVFPNPNDGKFVVDINTTGNKKFDLRVYNVLGKQVYAQKVNVINKTLIDLDLSEFSNGVYFINLKSDKESLNSKLIID